MEADAIGLFLHVVGGIGMCIALGIEWTGLWQLRSSLQPVQVRAAMGVIKAANKLGFISMLVAVIVALYAIWNEWGFAAWIDVSLVALLLVIALNMAVTRSRLMAVGRTLAREQGMLTAAFHSQANHPWLWLSIQGRAAILLGIIFLMVAKPDLGISLLTLAVSVVAGLAAAIPFVRRERVQPELAH